eukprot:m51a1_g527 hypothetical protein (409) ;mRNA; r:363477-364916
MLAKEASLSRGVVRTYVPNAASALSVRHRLSLVSLLYSAFLPEGFPRSVSSDYVPYQLWDTAQALCSTISGILSSKAVLTGLGVGDAKANAAAAASHGVVRDLIGNAGRIVFAWSRGTSLDRDAKVWRLVADALNDLAMLVELLAPCAPAWLFLPALCLASVMRAIVGIAGGATRDAMRAHQALEGNMADVSAKDGSQETAVNILGMLLGLAVLGAVGSSLPLTWAAFAALTAGHLAANWLAVRAVVLTTLNDQRLAIAAAELVSGRPVPSPAETNAREGVTPLCWARRGLRLRLGCRLEDACGGSVGGLAAAARSSRLRDDGYLVGASRREVSVCFVQDVGAEAQVVAALQANVARELIERGEGPDQAVKHAREIVSKAVEAGQLSSWNLSRPSFTADDWRVILKSE